jgi:hypothetical protein
MSGIFTILKPPFFTRKISTEISSSLLIMFFPEGRGQEIITMKTTDGFTVGIYRTIPPISSV